jgi:hypothetical protein
MLLLPAIVLAASSRARARVARRAAPEIILFDHMS